MADDPQDNFRSPVEEAAADTAELAATTLAAIISGAVIRVQELLSLADDAGHITVPVDSTCIAGLRYDQITSTMGVTFVDGGEYDYPSVGLGTFLAFVNAPSKGEFFNAHIRGTSPTHFAGSKKQRIRIGGR